MISRKIINGVLNVNQDTNSINIISDTLNLDVIGIKKFDNFEADIKNKRFDIGVANDENNNLISLLVPHEIQIENKEKKYFDFLEGLNIFAEKYKEELINNEGLLERILLQLNSSIFLDKSKDTGTLLDKLVMEFPNNNLMGKLMLICNKIFSEEKNKFTHKDFFPKSATIIISLQIPNRYIYDDIEKVSFLVMETDSIEDSFLFSRWEGLLKSKKFRRIETLGSIQSNSLKKIITELIRIYKKMIGE